MLVTFPSQLKFKSSRVSSFTKQTISGIFCSFSSSSSIRNASSPQHALVLFNNMHRYGASVDSFDCVFALKACSTLSNISLTLQIHAHLFKICLRNHVYVATGLLNCYTLCNFDEARRLFDEMPERNIVTWNMMITGHSNKGDWKSARSIFDSMPDRDVSSWSALITCYVANGKCSLGLSVFREMMICGGVKPDGMMMAKLLSGCSRMRSAQLLGKSIHAYVKKNIVNPKMKMKSGSEVDVILGTALVHFYAKCGALDCAYRVFDRIYEKNVMAWSVMISCLASHGHGREALSLFEEMRMLGVRPNDIAFTWVLSACCHAGLVAEGRENFRVMTKDFGLGPRIQHYGCMVDLLRKARLLEEAYELINTMELEPNVFVWSSFLASWKMHKHFAMAERVIERALLIAHADNGGGIYSLVSDLYALSGNWDDVEGIRKLMADMNVKKMRGSSFIQVEEPSMLSS